MKSRAQPSGTKATIQPQAPIAPAAVRLPIQAARTARFQSLAPAATPTRVVRPEPMPKASGTSMNSSRTPMP